MSELTFEADDNKIAFEEEKRNLDIVEGKIQAYINKEQGELNELWKEIKDYAVVDNEDRQNKIYLMEQRNKRLNTLDEVEEYKKSPYFGRFDMSCDGADPETYFVGETAINLDSERIVLDWRSELGNTFYNKRSHSFNINDYQYELLLRRSVDIKNARLQSVKTEYDVGTVSLEGEVIDPFLISVLRDKRRNYKLTNIIRTIQGNQNDIISRPFTENFVVQGCAGSGKTMILLHRLSYLTFNNPGTGFGTTYILTPNEFFNDQLEGLSRELNIDKINRMTVEDFYTLLINNKNFIDTVRKTPSGRNVPKLNVTTENLISEKLVNNKLLSEIYSEAFYESFINDYRQSSSDAAEKLNELGINKLLVKTKNKDKSISTINYLTFNMLDLSLNQLKEKHNKALPDYKANIEKAETLKKEASEKQEELKKVKADLITIKEDIRRVVTTNLVDIENQTGIDEDALRSYREKIELAKTTKASLFETVKAYEASLDSITANSSRLAEFEYLANSNDNIALFIREHFPEQLDRLKEMYAELGALAFYNFGKRSRVRNEITRLERQLSEEAKPFIDSYVEGKTVEIKDLRKQIAGLDKEITSANSDMAQLLDGNKQNEALVSAYKACANVFETERFPDLNHMMTEMDRRLLKDIVTPYIYYYQQFEKIKKETEGKLADLDRISSRINEQRDQILLDDEYQMLETSLEIVNQFDMTALMKRLNTKLRSMYEKYDQQFNENDNYRHKLYLKLLLCWLYYGPEVNKRYYINIDEAQDLSITEYKLLSEILGADTTYNLYGDVNQAIYEYKGISDWNKISQIVGNNIYLLNEDYRNTVEITDYCNKEFGAEITAIGLSGYPVKKSNLIDAMVIIENIHMENPKYRTAVIYKRGLSGIQDAVMDNLNCSISFNRIDNAALSVITVEEAKGLEFDAVVVIEDNMEINEKYVAYTRALDNLIVTSLAL